MSIETTQLTWNHPHVFEFVNVFGTNPVLRNARICLRKSPELVTLRDKRGNSLLHSCVWNGARLDFVELLMESGMDPDLKSDDGKTPRQIERTLPGREKLYHRICRFRKSPDLDDPFERERHELHQRRRDYDKATFDHELEKIALKQIKRDGSKDGVDFEDLDEETKAALNKFE